MKKVKLIKIKINQIKLMRKINLLIIKIKKTFLMIIIKTFFKVKLKKIKKRKLGIKLIEK